jgi:hypothetical protein
LQKLVANVGTPLQPRQYVDGQELEGAAKTSVCGRATHTREAAIASGGASVKIPTGFHGMAKKKASR